MSYTSSLFRTNGHVWPGTSSLPTLTTIELYLRLRAVPLFTSGHFVHKNLNSFLLEHGVQVYCCTASIHQKSSGVSSSAETLLQLCDIIANNGTLLELWF